MTASAGAKKRRGPKRLLLDVNTFRETHKHLNPALLLEHARVALAWHHESPVEVEVMAETSMVASVKFRRPNSRSILTLQPKEFIEKGAVVFAGLLLYALENKVITMVTEIGDRCDYFVGESPGDVRWLLEVSGTDHGNVNVRVEKKRNQLLASRHASYPFVKGGFVAVTRFARPPRARSKRSG